ncbi:hypothetical protein [Nocardia sp. NPDC050175]
MIIGAFRGLGYALAEEFSSGQGSIADDEHSGVEVYLSSNPS